MAVDQLPGQVREFASYLNGLLSRLDQGAGWCAVFWQRDPDGMQACLDGREVPPWDVVEAVLQDLAAEYGSEVAERQAERVRPLHAAALAAHDARPGGRDALGDRLDVMLREQRYAAERLADLGRRLPSAATHEQAEAIRLDLAWAHDDHERATARCAELRRRMAESDRLTASGASPGPAPHRAATPAYDAPGAHGTPAGYGAAEPTTGPSADTYGTDAYGTEASWTEAYEAEAYGTDVQEAEAYGTDVQEADAYGTDVQGADAYRSGVPVADAPAARPAPAEGAPAAAPASVPKQRKRRRGSARFAGMAEDEDTASTAVPPGAEPVGPAPATAGRRTLRGARFAGAAAENAEQRPEPRREPLDTAARRETVETVERLVRLRGEGRSGEAHALLVELAYWPAARIPLLAAELQRAGLTADWTTLLWEAASLPADRLVAAADALVAVGRTADGEQILRQGVARPAAEIGQAVLGLVGEGRLREVRALLDAYVRVRTPEEAARSVAPAPGTLVPLVLEAARTVSEERHWDLVHALRVAGFTA
ncbi:hypothetical protein [Streptomyces rishiriensis]|uniref:UL36 very large tegument protein n=1 Tax=Streptomyces rishiriensis TaxID=68264 RepID=A0ABU0NYY0_STRRH|nr:hypothetical protein [Streptomyces rishiriensis]MDQ0584329.1 hypothetical protein [Streptomyces rishiriensis]